MNRAQLQIFQPVVKRLDRATRLKEFLLAIAY